MTESRIGIVTPSYSRDAALCADLNESLMEFAPGWTHYVVADRRDISLFQHLEGPRTSVIVKEEVIPKGFRRLPGSRRWISPWSARPLGGWLMQQIAKLAAAEYFPETILVWIDSDVVIVRPLEEQMFVREGLVRMFREPDAISDDMKWHVEWHRNACRLLGVDPDSPPMPDYITQVNSWSKDVTLSMLNRVQEVTGRPWYQAVARTPQFSESLLYGAYVDKVLGPDAPVWIDEANHTLTYYDTDPLSMESAGQFVNGFGSGDVAVMITSHSPTPREVRSFVARALRPPRLDP